MPAETKVMREFREAVLTGLGELKVEVSNIVARLDRLNGSVARHESDLNSLKIADAKHDALELAVTRLQADVDKLKTSTLATDTKISVTEKYAGALWAAGGASFIALWQHLPAILKGVGEGK